jgi:hypothetical protein
VLDAIAERMVIIAINKATADKSVALRLSHSSRFAKVATYVVQGPPPTTPGWWRSQTSPCR